MTKQQKELAKDKAVATVPADQTIKPRQERQVALNRLSRQAFETGLYDKNEFPEGARDE